MTANDYNAALFTYKLIGVHISLLGLVTVVLLSLAPELVYVRN